MERMSEASWEEITPSDSRTETEAVVWERRWAARAWAGGSWVAMAARVGAGHRGGGATSWHADEVRGA